MLAVDPRRPKGLLKALIAFFLATGWSLLPAPNPLGPVNYLTSISTLFFHPNRTIGAQIEYTVFGIAGLLFGYGAALLSSATVILVNGTTVREGKSTMGVSATLAIWMFILTYFLGWLRTTMEKLFLATVLAHIVIIFHLTNIQTNPDYTIDSNGINSLIIPLAAGSACSLIVNIVFWFESAAVNLGSQLSSSLESTKTLLALCNRSFLLDSDPKDNFAPELEMASASLRDALNALTIAKLEAKREISYSVLKPSDISPAVASLRLIGQHLYGMALAARNEKILINQKGDTLTETKDQPSLTLLSQPPLPSILIEQDEPMSPNAESDAAPSADTEHSETQTTVRSISAFVSGLITKKQHGKAAKRASSVCGSDNMSEFCIDMESSKEVARGDKQIFMEFVNGVRGPLQELATTCALAINHVGEVLVGRRMETRRTERNTGGHLHLPREEITKSTFHSDATPSLANAPGYPSAEHDVTEIALAEFLNGTSKDYAHGLDLAIKHFDLRERAALEKLAERGAVASPRTEVFLVFFFVYSLREVAKELRNLVHKADALAEKRHQKRRIWFPYTFSLRGWTQWLNDEKKLARVPRKSQPSARPDGEAPGNYIGPTTSPNGYPLMNMAHSHGSPQTYYPVPNPYGWRFRIWWFLHLATGFEVKFGIKFAVAITLMSLPAFADSTRDWFIAVRGQWGLITLVAVMSNSVGGSISVSAYRIIGTITGSVWGYLTVIAAQHNPGIIAIFIIVFSPPFMYLYLFSKYPKIGLVSLLTNQVVTLSAYTCHCTNDDAFWLAVQRTFTMVVGVIVAVFITTYTWPYIARVELRRHLGRTMQDMGAYYSHLLEVYLLEDPNANGERIRMMKRNELKLQSALSQAGNLLALTSNEPRLKGPFQAGIYREIISSCQRLLDRLVGMRTAAMDVSGNVRTTYIMTVQQHRKQMVANILLYFYILSSALHSKAPLPPYLPKARESRKLLLKALQRVERRHDMEDLPSLTAFHAFAVLAEDVIEELERLGLLIKQIVGENAAVRGLFSEEECSLDLDK